MARLSSLKSSGSPGRRSDSSHPRWQTTSTCCSRPGRGRSRACRCRADRRRSPGPAGPEAGPPWPRSASSPGRGRGLRRCRAVPPSRGCAGRRRRPGRGGRNWARTAACAAGRLRAAATATTTSATSRARIGKLRDDGLIGASGDVCDQRKGYLVLVVGRTLPGTENARVATPGGRWSAAPSGPRSTTVAGRPRESPPPHGFGASSTRTI